MRNKLSSHLLKGLIALFILISIFITTYIIPIIVYQSKESFPELEHLALPLQIGAQLMMIMFIFGLILILYLLFLFDKGRVFSIQFTRVLNIISILCFIASIGCVAFFMVLIPYGGPGPGGFFVIPLILAIVILGLGLALFANVINQAIEYKSENDLTV